MYKNTLADAKQQQQQQQQQQNTTPQQQQILSDDRKIAIPARRWEQIKNMFLGRFIPAQTKPNRSLHCHLKNFARIPIVPI